MSKFFRWLSGDWNSEPVLLSIVPGTKFPVDGTKQQRRQAALANAIRFLGPKYCLRKTGLKKPER